MSANHQVFDPTIDYAKQFENEYCKKTNMPSVKCLNTFFHPTLRDHVIQINEINFPNVDYTKVKALFHEKIKENFENEIYQHYFDAADKYEARRRVKVAINPDLNYSSESEVDAETDSEDSSTYSSYDSYSFYEGGERIELQRKKSKNKRKANFRKSKMTQKKAKKNKSSFWVPFGARKQSTCKSLLKNYTVPGIVKEDYPKLETRAAKIRKFKRIGDQQELLNKAVDMYMEDKNTLMNYKNYDDSLLPEMNERWPEFKLEGTDMRIDDYIPDRPSAYPDVLYLEYYPIPEYDHIPYIPPPFREKYEICIWKIETNGATKIKSSYFTPELADFHDPDFGGFDVQMSLDHQTMILVENTNKDEETAEESFCSVLIFDIYTLDKISEFQIDLVDGSYLDDDDYNEDHDFENPHQAVKCPTSANFPRATCWNQGKYCMFCIGATPNSKICYELKIYDTEKNHIVSTIHRMNYEALSGLMYDIFPNPNDQETCIMIMKEGQTYSIVEVDFIQHKTYDICSVTTTNLSTIKISEDLSQIFTIRSNSQRTSFDLYCLKYGRDHDLEEESVTPTAELGKFIKSATVIGDLIAVSYEIEDGSTKIGLFKSNNKHVVDDLFKIDQAFGYSILDSTGQIMCLHDKSINGAKVTIFNHKTHDVNDVTYDLCEFNIYKFSYPEVAMVKGGSEVIKYNFNTKEYMYCKLPTSFTVLQTGKQNELKFRGLLDIGFFYVKAVVSLDDTKREMTFEADLHYIDKEKLPQEKILNILPDTQSLDSGSKESCFLLHLTDCLLTYTKTPDPKIQIKHSHHTISEVLWDNGLILFKKDSKRVFLIDCPLNFEDKSTYHIIYESNDIIKNIKAASDGEKLEYYIADQRKFLKVAHLVRDELIQELIIHRKMYVSKEFTGDTDFVVKSNMIYQGLQGSIMSETLGTDDFSKTAINIFNADLKGEAVSNPICSDSSVLFVSQNQDNSFRQVMLSPIFSDPTYTVISSSYSQEIKAEFFYYSRSLEQEFVVFLRQNKTSPYLIFDFYFSNGEYVFTKKHYIAGLKAGDYEDVKVKISPNGKYLFVKEEYGAEVYNEDDSIHVNEETKYGQSVATPRSGDSSALEQTQYYEGGDSSNSSSNFPAYSSSEISSSEVSSSISPQNPQNLPKSYSDSNSVPPVPSSHPTAVGATLPNHAPSNKFSSSSSPSPVPMSHPGNSAVSRNYQPFYSSYHGSAKTQKFYKYSSARMEGRIYEIVLLRRESTVRNIFKQAVHIDKKRYAKEIHQLEKQFHEDDILFDLKLVRTVEDVNKYFGEDSDENIQLTNQCSLAFWDQNLQRIFYDKTELTDFVQGLLGEDDDWREFGVADYSWVLIDSGYIAYRPNQAYYVRVDVTKTIEDNQLVIKAQPDCVIPFEFVLVTEDLIITNVFAGQNPDYVIVVLSNNLTESIFLVWSLSENKEIRNFSIKGEYKFIRGPKSETGYILNQTRIINLDTCLPNYFFDYDFVGFKINNPNGFKINMKEELIVSSGSLVMKTLYTEAVSLQRFLKGEIKVEEGQLAKHNLKFQIEGNTIFHLFALDSQALTLIIEYLERYKPVYLNAILMRNHEGFTPLDITVDNDSPKCTDLLLTALSKLKEAKYSDHLYKKFSKLLQMELKSFHHYLNSCKFKTVQMQNTKYLNLKHKGDRLVVAHHSCILDRSFIEKHTSLGYATKEIREKQKEILEKERAYQVKKMREYEKEQKKKQQTKKKKEEKRHARTLHKAKKHSDVYSGTLRTVGAQDVNLNMISNDDSSSIQISSYEDDSENLSSSLNEYSPRKFPGSQLNFNQIHNLHKEKEKVKKKKIEQKQKKLRLEQELKEKEEAKQKAHQDQIMAEKLKLVQEREKQKEAHKQGLKKYEIYAIEFDWLFDENHGRNFLVDLTKAQSLDVFSIDLIHQIIIFLWSFYRKRILLQIALPFLLYFFTFLTYATFIQNQAEQRGRDGAWYYINTICITIIFLMIFYNVYFELRKIWFYKIGYFTAYWNAVSFISLLLNSWVMIADLNEYDQDLIRPFLAVAVLIMYVRLLYFGRMFFSTAWMVRMINSVISDSRYFLIIFALSVIAFANSLAIISRNGTPPVTGGNYLDGIVYTYQAGLGEFDLDNFKANKDETILYFLWIAATFLILIVFLNLLIAIISDIFDKVHENISKNLLKELVFFMVESEFLINRRSIFKKCKYIILVNKEKGNTGEFDADSKLTVIRHAVDKQVQKHKNEVEKIQSKFSQNIHENINGRVEALESSSSKHLNLLEDKIEETEMLHGQLQSILEALNQME